MAGWPVTNVEIRVVEHLYRWNNWNITSKSDDFVKKDAQTIEFRVPVKPDLSEATFGVGRELFTRLREGATAADEGASIL